MNELSIPEGEMYKNWLLPIDQAIELFRCGFANILAVAGQKFIHKTIDYQGDGRTRNITETVPANTAYVLMQQD